jgi:hypothetical protein
MLSILWHDEESGGYTDHIETKYLARDGLGKGIEHFVTGPRSGKYVAKCDVEVSGDHADLDYRPYASFNEKSGVCVGVLRIRFADASRTRVSAVQWKDEDEERFATYEVDVAFDSDNRGHFEAQLDASAGLSAEARLQRLARAPTRPRQALAVSTVFIRNPDVVAHVLDRAGGRCESCKQPAPFNRASDGRPYLEVHHTVRLADDGEDSIDNAVALCPNCHRKAHYG